MGKCKRRRREREKAKIIKLTTCKHGFLLTVIGRSAAKIGGGRRQKYGRNQVVKQSARTDLKHRGACRRRLLGNARPRVCMHICVRVCVIKSHILPLVYT